VGKGGGLITARGSVAAMFSPYGVGVIDDGCCPGIWGA